MSRPAVVPAFVPAVVDALVVTVAALAARVVFAAAVTFPIPEDTAYYVGAARNLVEGRGLVTDALWSYATPPLVLPRPAFELWQPLPSLLAAIPMALLGASFRAAQLLPVVVGTGVALLAWQLARDLAAERGLAPARARAVSLGTGLAAAVALPLLLHSALPDSTIPFAAISLVCALLMRRLVERDRPSRRLLVALGLCIGLAGLTRSEAVWIGLAWAALAWRGPGSVRARLAQIAGPALVALLVYAPWALRSWRTFGTPLPGQAVTNALFVRPEDVFAWSDPPTLARYLAQGWPTILEQHVGGFAHDAIAVLGLPGFPLAILGAVALAGPYRRSRALQPLLLVAGITFLATSLLFPVATTWGTYLHAAGPAHVLLLVAGVAGLDAAFARLAARRGWGAGSLALTPLVATPLAAILSLSLASFTATADAAALRYERLATLLPAQGVQLGPSAAPLLTDHPIWLAETLETPALALPHEPPAAILDLARHFGATHVLLTRGTAAETSASDAGWPEALADGSPEAACFVPVSLPDADARLGLALWRIGCR